jgi:hypothetical protein
MRRRLLRVALMFPGAALAIAGAQILRRPEPVLIGLAWLVGGAVIWRLLTQRRLPPTAPSTPPSLSDDKEPVR